MTVVSLEVLLISFAFKFIKRLFCRCTVGLSNFVLLNPSGDSPDSANATLFK